MHYLKNKRVLTLGNVNCTKLRKLSEETVGKIRTSHWEDGKRSFSTLRNMKRYRNSY